MSPSNKNPNKNAPDRLLYFGSGKRLPMIMQTEVSECGLACLGMIANYHGYETDLISLRRKNYISSKGANLKNVMTMASKMLLTSRALRSEPEGLKHVVLPCILHWGLNHFVVLKAVKNNFFHIHDPAFGERVVSSTELGNMFSGVVLELAPSKDFIKGHEKQPLKVRHFWSDITGLKRNLIIVLILSFFLQLFALASPFYVQTVVDDVLLRKDTNLLLVLAVGFGFLVFIQSFTDNLRKFVVLHIGNRLGMQMSANLFRHLIRLPMEYFGKRHMGDVVSRFSSLSRIRELLTHGIVTAVIDGVMTLITLFAMFLYSVKLAIIVLFVALLYGALRWAFYRPQKLLTEERLNADAKESSHFMESVRAIQTIKLFQRENDRQGQWQNRLAEFMNKDISIAKWNINYETTNDVLSGLANIIVVYIAAKAVIGSEISLGMLFAFMSYKDRFDRSIQGLIGQWIDFKMLDVQLTRLADIVFTTPENIDDHIVAESELGDDGDSRSMDSPEIIPVITGKLEVRNLGFRYSEHEPYIFKGLNFVIQPGECIAIVGPSGCGKTTLLKCLMGLLKPTDGEILVDDSPITKSPHYRSQIAGVMQDDQLLSGDIAENISCFPTRLHMEKIVECAKLACIHEEINRMPMQYHTMVGDMGSNLSGGQKQRIVLARAIYRSPQILFMDEATSHLDLQNESMVNSHIKRLKITQILVAHRPETIKFADRIFDLSNSNNEERL